MSGGQIFVWPMGESENKMKMDRDMEERTKSRSKWTEKLEQMWQKWTKIEWTEKLEQMWQKWTNKQMSEK